MRSSKALGRSSTPRVGRLVFRGLALVCFVAGSGFLAMGQPYPRPDTLASAELADPGCDAQRASSGASQAAAMRRRRWRTIPDTV